MKANFKPNVTVQVRDDCELDQRVAEGWKATDQLKKSVSDGTNRT